MSTSKIKWYNLFLFEKISLYCTVIFICLIGSSFLGGMIPLEMTTLGKNYDDFDLYIGSLKKLGLIFVAVYVNRSIYQVTINKFVVRLVQNARMLCYKEWLLSYDLQTTKKNSTDRYPQGEVVARIIGDTESLRELITSGTFGILIDIFLVASCLFSFIKINFRSGLFLGVAEVLIAILLIWGSKYMRVVFHSLRKTRGDVQKTIADLVGGLGETYYNEHNNYAGKRGAKVFDKFLSKILKANFWDASYYSFAESMYPVLLAMVIFIFPYSKITDGAIIFAIVDLIQRSINPIKEISGKITNLQRAVTGVSRITSFLTDLEELPKNSEDHIVEKVIGFDSLDIKIENFTYPKLENGNEFSLENVKFTGKKSEVFGVVGMSGSGKSTLLNIIAGNIIAEKFTISVKGLTEVIFDDKNEEKILDYRECVGLVSQDSHIFSETVAFNISLSKEKNDELEEYWNWVKEQIPYLERWGLSLWDVIDQKTLSLGQKQLLAAIRACYLKKPIVLYDEISSALDVYLEEALRSVILLIQKNSLTIIVAHRVETLIDADRIIVMKDGKVDMAGKHDDLLLSSGTYQNFIEELNFSHAEQ